MKNSHKDYKNHIIFHTPTRRPDSGFVWFRGAYEIKKIGERKYILPSGKVTPYTLNNVSDLVLSLLNMDWDNETEILNFTKEYGLPGSANFLKQDREQLEKAFNLKWGDLFGIKEEEEIMLTSPMEQGVEWRDPAFWQIYREPLALFKLSVSRLKEIAGILSEADQVTRENKKKPLKIYDTQQLTELRWLNQKHGQIKLTLAFMSNSKAVWASPADSLIQVAYTFLIWNVGHNSTPIRKCKASERATGRMRVCNNYFWADDPKHRSEYCSTRCKNMVAAEKLQIRRRGTKQRRE